jgi:hypothetical protein
MDNKIRRALINAGFTPNQAETLYDTFALSPHEHTADQITDFDDAVRDVESESGEDDE